MILGPASSRLIKSTSVFVKQIEARDDDGKEVMLYGFAEKPELSDQVNWSVSEYLIVGSYSRKGFSLWLNKGSSFRIKCEAQTTNVENLEISISKGEHGYRKLQPNPASNSDVKAQLPIYDTESEYSVNEDDKYYVGLTNTNSRSIILTLHLNVSSKMYDTSKAISVCSAVNGSCRLHLAFPSPHYITVSTPNDGGLSEWYIELSFAARVVTYIAILGFVVLVIYLILKYFGSCGGDRALDDEHDAAEAVAAAERVPIISIKQVTYGTCEEEDEELGNSNSSSEDLYDGKICVICYDELRNCFFIPCGHCATCYDCAQRIMGEESKVCPICRRLIHKLKFQNPRKRKISRSVTMPAMDQIQELSSPFGLEERVLAYHNNIPYDAKVIGIAQENDRLEFHVHYWGWKDKYNEWVTADRLLKRSDENLKLLDKICKQQESSKHRKGKCKKRKFRTVLQTEDWGNTVDIQVPYSLRKQLSQDCEMVAHMGELVNLPCSPNVDEILNMYVDNRLKKGEELLDSFIEIIKGVHCYFDKALPAMLLYKNERQQYHQFTANQVPPSKVYGAEHLLRLLVKLPELLYKANIEEATLEELKEKLQDFMMFLQDKQSAFFVSATKVAETSTEDKMI